jgi:general stress protein 26
LYFLTRKDDEKLRELERRQDVSVVMQRADQYLSISGRARLIDNAGLVEELWSLSARIWFPQGPGDPNLALLYVEPVYAESWDRSGIRKLEFWWAAGKALLRRKKAGDDTLSGHKKVKL